MSFNPKQDLVEFAKDAMGRHEAMQAATRREASASPPPEIRRTFVEMAPPKGFANTPQKGRKPLEQPTPPATFRALQIHSRTDGSGNLYVGLGPYGNLWDSPVSGDLTVVTIDGRLADPSDPGDTGWIGISSGDNLYLECEITDGDISAASLVVGTSEPLSEFTDYTQTLFRVILAHVETIDTSDVVVPMHEGELVAFWDVINSKLAKYAR